MIDLINNPIFDTDSYKVPHWRQTPQNPCVANTYSYLESRTGSMFDTTLWYGLQGILNKLGSVRVTYEHIREAAAFFEQHFFGDTTLFNREGWDIIVREYGGRFPVTIKAAPEGMVIPKGNVLMTIENEDPRLGWLTNYLETRLMRVWYPTTVATQSREAKKVIADGMASTGTGLEGLPFKLHDFGARGVSSPEQAMIGGAAHLVNFAGTDTVLGMAYLAENYYPAEVTGGGRSIPAAEHSTVMAHGPGEGERKFFEQMIREFGTGGAGVYAVVSDTYDLFNASDIWNSLAGDVRKAGNMLVVRPDSGDPSLIVPELLERLENGYGSEATTTGHKLLSGVRVIQGDGMNLFSMNDLIETTKARGFAIDNLAFGMGAGLLQNVNRDTLDMAIKASHVTYSDGTTLDIKKTVKTMESKASKAGRLSLVQGPTGLVTVPQGTESDWLSRDLLETVFAGGEVKSFHTIEQIRERAAL